MPISHASIINYVFDWYVEGKFDYLLGKPFQAPASCTRVSDREDWEKGYIEGRAQFPYAHPVQRSPFGLPIPVVSDRELSASQRIAFGGLRLQIVPPGELKALYQPHRDYLRK